MELGPEVGMQPALAPPLLLGVHLYSAFPPPSSLSSHRAVGAHRGGLGSDQLRYEGGREESDGPGQVLWPLLL